MTSYITPYQYFYDGQQRRFLEQIVRAFSGFSYQTGMQNGAPPQTVLVPCHMALTNQIIATIRANASENAANTVPMITVWQTGLTGRQADLQNTAFIDHRQVFEREIIDGQYGPGVGNTYSVDRLMPLPFTMTIQVDVWTSNMDQKLQLMEQMLVAMWPEFQIQNSDNALDWTATSVCFVEDEIEFSSRSLPIGTASSYDNIDIFSLKLRLPMYLTAPAKVRKLSRINQIIANIGDTAYDCYGEPVIGNNLRTVIVTPGDHSIFVDGNVITLLNKDAGEFMEDGNLPSWTHLLDLYGSLSPNVSQLRLYLTDDIEGPFVAGTIQSGSVVNQIIWTIDPTTLPANTLLPINAVIDPLKTYPGQIGGPLPTPTTGTRYMLVNDIGSSFAWGALSANTNDIIQYSGAEWIVVFNSRKTTTTQFVLNSSSGRQLYWTGSEWVMSIDQYYPPGLWRIFL